MSVSLPSEYSTAQLKQSLQKIWLGMVFAIVCYAVLGVVIHVERLGSGPSLTVVLWGLSIASLGGGWGWYQRRDTRIRERLRRATIQSLTDEERTALRGQLFFSSLVLMGCVESAVVFGLFATLLGDTDRQVFYAVATLSVAALVVFRIRGFPAIWVQLDQLDRVMPRPQ